MKPITKETEKQMRRRLKRQRSYVDPEYSYVRDLVTDRGGNPLPHVDRKRWEASGVTLIYYVRPKRWYHYLCCWLYQEEDDL